MRAGSENQLHSLRPCGDRAVLICLTDETPPAAVAGAARGRWSSLVDAVPGHDTVQLTFSEHRPGDDEVSEWLDGQVAAGAAHHSGRLIEIPVVYDGPDIDEVARISGISPEAVIELHRSVEYRAEFSGFAPGFTYLTGLPERLQVPRRDDPRERVPRGSVAIAGVYSAVYPGASPGGWNLLGTTQLVMFDPTLSSPALVVPGDRVRFTV